MTRRNRTRWTTRWKKTGQRVYTPKNSPPCNTADTRCIFFCFSIYAVELQPYYLYAAGISCFTHCSFHMYTLNLSPTFPDFSPYLLFNLIGCQWRYLTKSLALIGSIVQLSNRDNKRQLFESCAHACTALLLVSLDGSCNGARIVWLQLRPYLVESL